MGEGSNEDPKPAVNRRDAKFKNDLLAQLATLSIRQLGIPTSLELKSDLGSIMDLDGDALLEPLEKSAPTKSS